MGSAARVVHTEEATHDSNGTQPVRLHVVRGATCIGLPGRSVGMRRADVLIEAMRALGWGVRKLAHVMGVDEKEVRRWRAGKDFADRVDAMGSVGAEVRRRLAIQSEDKRDV